MAKEIMEDIIEYDEGVRKKVGGLIYHKCKICGDISRTQNLFEPFCINQHKDAFENELQPESCGTSMHGKMWEETPEGAKMAREQKAQPKILKPEKFDIPKDCADFFDVSEIK